MRKVLEAFANRQYSILKFPKLLSHKSDQRLSHSSCNILTYILFLLWRWWEQNHFPWDEILQGPKSEPLGKELGSSRMLWDLNVEMKTAHITSGRSANTRSREPFLKQPSSWSFYQLPSLGTISLSIKEWSFSSYA